MNDELVLLVRAATVLNTSGIRYFVSGSVAAMQYGEPRMTRDIDIVVHLRFADVATITESLGEPDFYVSREAVLQALESDGQFNVIHNATGLKIDFMCAERSAFNDSRFARARSLIFDGVPVPFASAEDVILKKLQYFKEGGSDKHLRDVASMIRISGDGFDRSYLDTWAARLGVAEEWGLCKARCGW